MLEVVGSVLRDYSRDHGVILDASGGPPIRTALLHPYIEQRGVVDKINIFEANIHSKRIVAMVQKFRGQTSPYSGLLDVANIYYAANHNYCWRRFGVCKEMYHCMIDRTDADRVASLDTLTTLLEQLSADTTAITGGFQPLNREQEAELLALETLIPVEFRQQYLESPISGDDEYLTVAQRFKIPVEYARLACQPNYVRAVTQLRGRLLDFK